MRFLLAALTAALLIGAAPFPTPANAQSFRLELEVTKITPSVVDGPGEVTVSGTLRNAGASEIHDIEGRVERGAAVTGDGAVQEAMRGNGQHTTQPDFQPLTERLAPGQSIPFELRLPVAGARDSLQITEPGSYPLMVNINGRPSDGSRARLAEAGFLLPVLSTPEAPPVHPPQPLPMTMVVPIVDYPRMEGVEGDRPVLADEQLAHSISPAGRLFDLVQTINEQVQPGSPLAPSVCFAVDPDLLDTVEAMQSGYRVRQDDGSTREGIGAGAAKLWLDKLRQATNGRCVIGLPYADADVVALGRADLPDLIDGALDGADIISRVLRLDPRKDVFWPIDGALDEPAATTLADLGVNTMLLRPNSLADTANPLGVAKLNTKHSPSVLPIDPLLESALDPTDGRTVPSPERDGAVSVQNVLGTLAYRGTTAGPETMAILAPPRRWNLRAADLEALFSGMEALHERGLIEPTGLPSAPSGPETGLAYPAALGPLEIQQSVLDRLARENFKVGDLYRSSEKDPAANIERSAVTTPLRDALLRGASSAWRGNPAASRYWVRKGTERLSEVLSAIQVDLPPNVVTLGASNGSIPVKVSNQLPITVKVILRTARTSGIEITPLGVLSVPQGGRSFWPEAEAQRAGRFTVDIIATTEAGTRLGSPKRLQVESSNYGSFVLMLTGAAAVLLVVLSGLRIARRIRARMRRSTQSPATTDGDGSAD